MFWFMLSAEQIFKAFLCLLENVSCYIKHIIVFYSSISDQKQQKIDEIKVGLEDAEALVLSCR